jgi:hypothetical protein
MTTAERFDQRFRELKASPHLQEQVRRVMKPLEMVRGTAACPSFEEVLRAVAVGIYALEETPDCQMTHGLVGVRRNPASGYDLVISVSTVYDLHMKMEEVKV